MLEPAADGGCKLDGIALWGIGDSGGCGCGDFSDGCWYGDFREVDQAQTPCLANIKLLDV